MGLCSGWLSALHQRHPDHDHRPAFRRTSYAGIAAYGVE